jgi:hypothetical protein
MNRKSGVLVLAAGIAVAWAAGSAAAGESKVTVVKAGDALNAVKVTRDKDTGKLRPATPEEAAQIGRASAPGYAPAIVVQSHPVTSLVTNPDGSITVRRSLDDLDKVMISRTADGKVRMGHGEKGASHDNASKPTE